MNLLDATGYTVETLKETLSMLMEDPIYVEEEDDQKVVRMYVGTIFSLTPSGKMHMPWATSNLDPCPVCGGSGVIHDPDRSCETCGGCGSKEAYEDELFWEETEDILSEHGMWAEPREGDPCDVFICWAIPTEERGEEETIA